MVQVSKGSHTQVIFLLLTDYTFFKVMLNRKRPISLYFKHLLWLTLLLFSLQGVAQEEEADFEDIEVKANPEPEAETSSPVEPRELSKFRPTLSLGVGMMNYYGELSKNDQSSSELISAIGYDFRASFPLGSAYALSFHVVRGKLAANERALERSLNFQSTITTGGFEFSYNFDHLMPSDRIIYPTVSIGLHVMEFLSKTDLFDTYGNRYHYWSDGSIRNLAENSENASKSIRLQRDYVYESDIREQNLDGLGAYPEMSFAIPIGIGVNLELTERIDFRLGTNFFWTFTDQIDGISAAGTGVRQGGNPSDKFLFSNFSLSFDLSTDDRDMQAPEESDVDLLALQNADEDGDGVADFKDACPNTPASVEVDSVGCPLDGDIDGVANFKDQELQTPDSMFVDTLGVGLTAADLERIYMRYIDSTGRFAAINDTVYASQVPTRTFRRKSSTFLVQVDGDRGNLSSGTAEKILGEKGVQTVGTGDEQIVAIGEFTNIEDAKAKQKELIAKGIASSAIIEKSTTGRLVASEQKGIFIGDKSAKDLENIRGITYRIQLGAFRQTPKVETFHKLGEGEILPVQTDDGFTRVYFGTFNSYADAERAKQRVRQLGYPDALVKAFATPGRGSGTTSSSTGMEGGVNETPAKPGFGTVDVNTADKSKVRYKVQVGSYSKAIPNDRLSIAISVGNVSSETTETGMIRYFVGSFSDKQSAEKLRSEVVNGGIKDAYVVGEYDGNTIKASDADRILAK